MRSKRFIPVIVGLAVFGLASTSLVLAQRPGGPPGQGPGQGPGGPPPFGSGGPNGPGSRPGGPFGDMDRPGRRPPRPPGENGPPRPEANLDFAAAEMLGNRRVVRNAPYTAEAVTEMTQVLANGTKITQKSTAIIARDSDGRTRRELQLDTVGPFVVAGGGPPLVLINDPAAKAHFWLNADDHSARKIKDPKDPPPIDDQAREGFADGKVESLGTRSFDGILAEGTRSTITIQAGEIGNDQPLEIVSERWYSPDLQMVIMSSHSDPRHGDHVYRLTNLKRAEPDPALFRVPSDYQIREEKPPPLPQRNRTPPGMREDGPLPRLYD